MPGDRNVVQKEAEQKLKYKCPCKERQRMSNMKCMAANTRVIIGATGIATKGLKKKSGSHTRKTLNTFTTKDSYTWNITHNTQSTAV